MFILQADCNLEDKIQKLTLSNSSSLQIPPPHIFPHLPHPQISCLGFNQLTCGVFETFTFSKAESLT